MNKIKFWWNCSRAFALPVTVMSWLAVFVYGIISGGNAFYGILALIGVCFAHLAANIFDDYFDYNILSKDEKYLKSAQICKCKFITDGFVTHKGLLIAGLVCLLIAVCFGALLTFFTGWGVVLIALLASVFVIFYSKFTFIGLGELAVGITYGPLLFEGVYYVMTGAFSLDVLILSLGVSPFVIAFLYTHTILDYDGDLCSHKKTLAVSFADKNSALKVLPAIYLEGFVYMADFAYLTQIYCILLTFLVLPLIYLLYVSLQKYNEDKTAIPPVRWWNYPLGNWAQIEKEGTQSFYLRLYLARNITTYFTVLVCIAFVLEKFL